MANLRQLYEQSLEQKQTVNQTKPNLRQLYENSAQATTQPVQQSQSFKPAPVTAGDVIKGLPKASFDVGKAVGGFATELIKPLVKFGATTGSVIGEGLAYATNPKVREEYAKGRLDVMPNISKTSQKDIAIDTVNAMVEATLWNKLPPIIKTQSKLRRTAQGAGEGLGFWITDSIARDRTLEETVKGAPLAVLTGGVAGRYAPLIERVLTKELGRVTNKEAQQIKKLVAESRGASKKDDFVFATDDDVTAIIGNKSRSGQNPEKQKEVYNRYMKNKVDNLRKPSPDEEIIFYQPTEGQDQYVNTRLQRQFHTNIDDNFVAEVVPRRRLQSTGDEMKDAVGERLLVPQTKTTKVPKDQMPVGGGETKASTLSKRLAADDSGAVTYKVSNHEKSIGKVEKHYKDNDKLIQDLISGKTDLDVEVNALLPVALSRTNQMTPKQLQKLSTAKNIRSLAATRMGQEISILQRIDPNNRITAMADIIEAEQKAYTRKTGVTPEKARGSTKKEVIGAVEKRKIKKDALRKLIDDNLCKNG